jgi:hypothetical protein
VFHRAYVPATPEPAGFSTGTADPDGRGSTAQRCTGPTCPLRDAALGIRMLRRERARRRAQLPVLNPRHVLPTQTSGSTWNTHTRRRVAAGKAPQTSVAVHR